MESFFVEMKRYMRFGPDDETALVALAPPAEPRYRAIADEFYARLIEHEEARTIFSGPEQVERLKVTLVGWMHRLLRGPWDEDYYRTRARIGQVHVRIGLAQRYMFGAMDQIRMSFIRVAHEAFVDDAAMRLRVVLALHKILDLELAIMLETFREAYVDKIQNLERLEKSLLERRLALSEARYEEIVEKGPALIVTTGANGRVHLLNRRCEELLGLDRRQAEGREWLELFVPEADRRHVRDRWDDVLSGKLAPAYEGPVATPTGERRVRWHFTTLPGASGPVLCHMGLDVTEERELALRTRRAERLASLGTMAAGLAHEIRNPLNAAHLQLTLVARRLARAPAPDLDGARGAADLASGEMKRLAGLVEEFLQFARPQPLRVARGDLRATAESICSLLAPEAEAAGVELAVEDGAAVPADIDDERMKQVLLNLVRNAIEATGRGGRVRLRVAGAHDAARIEVEDDGRGLPGGDAPIFEPFFTTKPAGTGLGLAIVHRIVTDHGGTVDVASRPGRTVFAISLPTVG